MKPKSEWMICILLFLFSLTVYVASPIVNHGDPDWYIPIAISILREGNINIDEYADSTVFSRDYRVARHNGHYYSIFPIGVPVIITPFVFGANAILRWTVGPLKVNESSVLKDSLGSYNMVLVKWKSLSKIIASLIVALTGVILYLIGRIYLTRNYAILLAVIFAFGTAAWSIASRALWQHGPSMLMLTLTLFLILQSERRRESLVQFAGVSLALSYVIRPTNIVPLMFISIYILINHRKYFWHFSLYLMLILLIFFFYNYTLFQHFIPPYYSLERLRFNLGYFTAFWGNILSPARGIFIYSPVFLFSLYGIYIKFKNRSMNLLDYCLLAIIFSHLLAISSFPHWWGGHSYGYRFFSDMVPYFIYYLIPFLKRLPQLRQRIVVPIFCLSILVSVFIHCRGACSSAVHDWNLYPENVDQHSYRLWDLKDLPFLRGI